MSRGKEWSKTKTTKSSKGKVYTTTTAARFFTGYRVYRNTNAWQTKVTWTKEVSLINDKMVAENRKILLLVDNFSGHYIEEFSNVRLEF